MILVKTIKYIFKTLVNNSVIVENRKRKWYQALIIFLVALILSLVPTIVSVASIKGSSIIETGTQSLDEGLIAFSSAVHEKGIVFKVTDNSDAKAHYKKIITINDPQLWKDNFADGFEYSRKDGSVDVKRLVVNYYDKNESELTEELNKIRNRVYDKNSLKVEEREPIVSQMLIGRETSYILVYAKNAESWSKYSAVRTLNYRDFQSNDEVISSYVGDNAIKNWISFINTGYGNIKTSSVFAQIGIFAGINIAVAFFMALVLFIITRGKRNPNRDIKFIETIKIVGVASLAPALLSCLFGFLIPAYATMMFMMLLGLRIMWMASKCLSPYAQQAK